MGTCPPVRDGDARADAGRVQAGRWRGLGALRYMANARAVCYTLTPVVALPLGALQRGSGRLRRRYHGCGAWARGILPPPRVALPVRFRRSGSSVQRPWPQIPSRRPSLRSCGPTPRSRGATPAYREKEFGIWKTWTWAEVAEQVRYLALGLRALGLERGDRFAIIGDNRPHLYWSFTAGQSIGAIPVPCYQDSVADEIAYVCEHAGVRVAVVEDQEQVDKLLEARDRLPGLQAIVYTDSRGLERYDGVPGLTSFDSVIRSGKGPPQPGPRGLPARARPGPTDRHCRHSLYIRHHRPSQGSPAHPRQPDRARPARREI